jgi:predicted nucleotide-binding protein
MARKTTPAPIKAAPALLAKPREEVRAMLLSRIEAGLEIVNRPIARPMALLDCKIDYNRWNDFNVEFLRRAFTNEEFAEQYKQITSIGIMVLGGGSSHDEVGEFQSRLNKRIERLQSIAERLDLIDEQPGISAQRAPLALPQPTMPDPACSKKVFLVHGQDEEAKAIVSLFLASCNLEPIVLHDQPNGGLTIIEKFEREADVGFAVILLTPDDVGGPRSGGALTSDDLKLRARQNVILELGYFVGRLSRGRVAALKKGDIELPSDISGVVWTAMDASNAWKMNLARELKAAGYEFDLGKALGI